MPYSCWLIDDAATLLDWFPPVFPDVVAHHITYQYPDRTMPPDAHAVIVGELIDPDGVQVLLVRVIGQDGNDILRPDGRALHATWSIDRSAGKKPASSNDSIERLGDQIKQINGVRVSVTPNVE